MLNNLSAIKFNQFSVDLYLTKISASDLVSLFDKNILRVEKYQKDEEETYQRILDLHRIKELSDFLIDYKKDEVVKPLLPASIIINVPDEHDIDFDEKTGKLSIKKNAKLNIVDGQHRARGVCEACRKEGNIDFEIPVTFITDLEKFQEAAQFLIINVKQKSVRTDLTLTVLYELEQNKTHDFIKRLKKVLKIDAWQLEATAISIALNLEHGSPWYNLIMRPNEDRKTLRERGRGWVPIRQAHFVDTLRQFCSINSDTKSKTNFLIKLWNEIYKKYKSAFDPDTGKNYILLKGSAVGPIHILASLLYNVENSKYDDVDVMIDKFVKHFPLKFWERNGKDNAGNWGTSQKEYTVHAQQILKKIFPEFYEYWDADLLDQFIKNDAIGEEEEENINDLFDPFDLKPFDELEEDLKNKTHGCYVLVNKTRDAIKVYCGQSKRIKDRLSKHERSFKLFNSIELEKDELDKYECLIYHLIKSSCRTNDDHPPVPKYTKKCPYCNK